MLFDTFFSYNTGMLVEKIVYVLIIIAIASIIAKIIATAISRFGKQSGLPDNVISSINKIITYFIAFIGFVMILDVFQFNITTFVASFGIMGLVIGLSSQAIISNFISGILIMLEKPFDAGDVIDIMGSPGIVEDISIRNTRIRTFDGRMITVPNSTFSSSAVVNYSKTGGIQVKIPLSLTAGADLEKVSKIMISAAKNRQGIQQHDIEVLVTGITLGDSSWNVGVELRFWINQVSDRDSIVSSVAGRIKEEFAKEKIMLKP
jgi:small conductance mechanosensitive channel